MCCPFAWLFNCCKKSNDYKDEKYNNLMVIKPHENDEDDEDDRAGQDNAYNPRANRKAIDDKFKALDNFLNKKVLKSLVESNTDTGTRLD